jgi:hypothetical protein
MEEKKNGEELDNVCHEMLANLWSFLFYKLPDYILFFGCLPVVDFQ